MKKEMLVIWIIFSFVFMAGYVLAEVNLNPLSKTVYNKGDSIKVSGYVRSSESGNFPISLFLSCNESQEKVLSRNINVLADKDYAINYEVAIPYAINGDCQLLVNFSKEQVSSEHFQITKSLRGTFSIIPLSAQLGDEVTFTGTITKLNGDQISGTGTIYLEKDNENYITENVQIIDSRFQYKTKIENLPEGAYHVNLEVNDLFGNEEFFRNAASLNVYSKFNVNVMSDKKSYNPQDIALISGNIIKTVGVVADKAIVRIIFNGQELMENLIDNKFQVELQLPPNIKSGMHELNAVVTDDFGNVGEKSITLTIIPREISLEGGIEKETYLPKELVKFKPVLLDQAADEISDTIMFRLSDPKGKVSLEKQIPANEEFSFKLNQYALPGSWNYFVESKSLKSSGSFNVESVEMVSILLNGQALKIKNIGNVPYKKNIIINAVNIERETKVITLRTNIEPNKEFPYDLFNDLKPNVYDIYIDNTNDKFEQLSVTDPRDIFERIGDFFRQATGAAVGVTGTSNNNKPLAFMLLLVFGILLVIFTSKFKKKARFDFERDRERRMGQRRLQQLQNVPEIKRPRFGKATPDDVKDFQQRIKKDLEINSIRQPTIENANSENKSVRTSIERKILFDRYKRE